MHRPGLPQPAVGARRYSESQEHEDAWARGRFGRPHPPDKAASTVAGAVIGQAAHDSIELMTPLRKVNAMYAQT